MTARAAVLLDGALPDTDLLQFIRDLQQALAPRLVPIIALTTAVAREALLQHLSADIAPLVTILTKPVTPQQITATLTRVTAVAAAECPTRVAPLASQRPLQGLRLLLVEDNEVNRLVATELLSNEGAVVDIAIGGQEGVDQVLAGDPRYDVVLMDMQMPNVDGLAATRQIRAHPQFAELPILAMTANVAATDQQACLQAGMNAHLKKPLEMEQVIASILQFSGKAQLNSTAQPAELIVLMAVAPMPVASMSVAANTPATVSSSTLESLLQPFAGNEKFYRRLIASFEKNLLVYSEQMAAQIATADRSAVLATLHTLKGSSGSIGFVRMHQALCALEQQLKAALGADAAEFDRLAQDLVGQIAELAQAEFAVVHALLPQVDPA
jgi:CheY-like chemotaxis protein